MLGKIIASASSVCLLATIASAALTENRYSTVTTRTTQTEVTPSVETVPSITIRERSYVIQPAVLQPVYIEPSSTTTVIEREKATAPSCDQSAVRFRALVYRRLLFDMRISEAVVLEGSCLFIGVSKSMPGFHF